MNNKTVMFIYAIGGLATGSMIEPWLKNKNPITRNAQLAISGVAIVLIVGLVWMFLKAARGAKNGQSAMTAYTLPVVSAALFLFGIGLLLF
ncbi:MAG: hypothetical protein NXI04_00150 [Planctomycetaceae bacterium]|nr:hypothetical protein [Planctomycetaceae bacterium]